MPRELVTVARGTDTLAVYLGEPSRWRSPVYLTLLLAVVAALVALPLVRVSVAVQAGGLVRPETDKREIRVPMTGRVARIHVRDNQRVRAGEPLAELDGAGNAGDLDAARFRLRTLDAWSGDLAALAAGPRAARPSTARYRNEQAQLAAELDEVGVREAAEAESVRRAEALFARQLAAPAEVEAARARLSEARAAARSATERFRTRWQGELAQLEIDRRDLAQRVAQLERTGREHRLVAPVSGTVEQLTGVPEGGTLQGGERFAVVSPDSAAVAEIYVTPQQVGTIRPGMPVRMQVDAFRSTDWGYVSGRVIDVSDDFVQVGEMPLFRVRASLGTDRLTLPNGAVGHLRKGMTVRAHFVLARRSLLQLLSDRASDWLDPSRGR